MQAEDTAGNMIREINDELARRANNALRADGMTLSQMGVLVHLDEAPDGLMTIGELGRELHVTQPTMSGLVNRLEKKKLVKVLGDPADRRVRNILITEQGRGVCRRGEEHMRQHEERLLHDLAPDERGEFLRLLGKVRDGLLE